MHISGQTRKQLNCAAVLALIIALLVNPIAAVAVQAAPVAKPATEPIQAKPATPVPPAHGPIDTTNRQLAKPTKVNKNTDHSASAQTARTTFDIPVAVLGRLGACPPTK